jgi:hypothetical protein
MRQRFSPGVVLGLTALVLAMSGSAYAASKITGAQIKDSTITTKDIKDRTISGKDIADVSLSTDKLTNGALQELKGAPGPTGPAGAPGPQGAPGPSIVSKIGSYKFFGSLPAGDTDIFTATCPAGHSVVNGGYAVFLGDVWLSKSYDGRSWSVGISTFDNSIPSTDNEIWAFCAPTGSAVAGIAKKSGMTTSARDAAIKADIAKYRAAVR